MWVLVILLQVIAVIGQSHTHTHHLIPCDTTCYDWLSCPAQLELDQRQHRMQRSNAGQILSAPIDMSLYIHITMMSCTSHRFWLHGSNLPQGVMEEYWVQLIQEVELRVLPLWQLPFIYIIEVAVKLLFESQNPKNTLLGYDTIIQHNDKS